MGGFAGHTRVHYLLRLGRCLIARRLATPAVVVPLAGGPLARLPAPLFAGRHRGCRSALVQLSVATVLRGAR
eukprot:15432288-Alexandrium_andersonii.AAC.1